MKIVVVTGFLGFIGVHVTRALLDADFMVYGIDKLTYAANENLLSEFAEHPNFDYTIADIKDVKWIPDCDYVINLAAESHVANSINDSDEFIDSNIVGVKNLLNLVRMKHANVNDRPIFFQMSTDEVYGDIEEDEHTEEDLLRPSNPYSASKAAADMLVMAWSRTYGIDYIILRPTNNYGKHQYPEKLLPIAVKNLMREKPIVLHNGGTPVRNWLHAADTANAIRMIIESGTKNEIYNISGGYAQTNKKTVDRIIEAFNVLRPVEPIFDPDVVPPPSRKKIKYAERQGQDMRYALDDRKLRTLVGWKPERRFNYEIEEIVRHYMVQYRW